MHKRLSVFYQVTTWLHSHPGRTVTEKDFTTLFTKAYGRGATVANATNGFRKTGICPFNPNVFTDEDFIASNVNDRPDPAAANDHPLPAAANNHPLHSLPAAANDQPLPAAVNDSSLHPHRTATHDHSLHPLHATAMDHPLHDVANDPSTSATFASISVVLNHKPPARKTVQRKVGHAEMITSATFEAELVAQKEKNDKIQETRKRRAEIKEKRKNDKEKQASKKTSGNKTRKRSNDKGKNEDKICNVHEDEEDTDCLYCHGLYSQSREPWIQCTQCELWAHISCSGVDEGAVSFICERCEDE